MLDIENRSLLLASYSIVLKHSGVYPSILALKLEGWRWCFCIEDEVVVAVRAILVTVFEFLGVFSKALLAFFASKSQVKPLEQLMVFLFLMTFYAVEPFATAWGPYGDLSVEDVLAADRLHPGT